MFGMFIEWSRKPKKPIQYQPGQYSEEPWISKAVLAWMLGCRFSAPRFEAYALSQFIQNCAVILQGPWKFIDDQIPSSSSISLFNQYWVAWNCYLSGSGVNEYSGLSGSRKVSQVKPSTRDPRLLELDHWYSECAHNINTNCEHDLILKEQKEKAAVAKNKTPPPEWGADWEYYASRRI